jgi:hypothetical protein
MCGKKTITQSFELAVAEVHFSVKRSCDTSCSIFIGWLVKVCNAYSTIADASRWPFFKKKIIMIKKIIINNNNNNNNKIIINLLIFLLL